MMTLDLVLIILVILFLALGGLTLHYNRIISQRNVKLRRILNGLEAYRKMMDSQIEHSLDTPKNPQNTSPLDEGQRFFVKMDAKMSIEKPFLDPSFDHNDLVHFSGVPAYEFVKLMPNYSDPNNAKSYINSRRAEYGAQLIVERPELSIEEIAQECGFRKTAAFVVAFKFAFGLTPKDYREKAGQLLKAEV